MKKLSIVIVATAFFCSTQPMENRVIHFSPEMRLRCEHVAGFIKGFASATKPSMVEDIRKNLGLVLQSDQQKIVALPLNKQIFNPKDYESGDQQQPEGIIIPEEIENIVKQYDSLFAKKEVYRLVLEYLKQ